MISNKYTKQYQEFKLVDPKYRIQFNQKICSIPMENSDLQYQEVLPDYFDKLQVIENSEKIQLTIYIWYPKNPVGILFLVHGFNGHITTLSYIAKQIKQKNNLIVVGQDFRNFGRSGGKDRGLIRNPDNLVKDLQMMMEWAIAKYKPNPKIMFLAGLSLGGSMCFKLALRKKYDYRAVIFFSPGFSRNPVNKMNLGIIHIFKILFLKNSYLFPPTFTSGCKHKIFMQKIKNDPYTYTGWVRAGSIAALGKFLSNIPSSMKQFDLPYLFVQSGVDKVVDPCQMIDFDKNSKSTDKTNFFVKDMWHAVCYDKEINELMVEVCKWIDIKSKL